MLKIKSENILKVIVNIEDRLKNSYLKYIPWQIVRMVILIGCSFIILMPLLTKLSQALMTTSDLFDQTVKWIPRQIHLQNFRMAWEGMNFPKAFANSFFLAILVSLLQLISCSLIGYGLARFDFRGKNVIFALVIFTLIVPPQMNMVPIYLNFRFFNLFCLLGEGVNLLGTYWPFIFTALTGTAYRSALFIYIMRQFFKGMPKGLEEAAYVDGAGGLKTFYKVMLPGALPAMLIVLLFSFVWQWNDDYFTILYLGDKLTLPYALNHLTEAWTMEAQTVLTENAGMLLFMSFPLILFAFLQRYFIESVERTGIVG
ncbi:MAG: carbohydrate ABC transporter permease [bacterium]